MKHERKKWAALCAVIAGLALFAACEKQNNALSSSAPELSSAESITASASVESSASSSEQGSSEETRTYTLNADVGEGCAIAFAENATSVLHGGSVVVSVQITGEAYDENTLSVAVNGVEKAFERTEQGFVVGIENITENITVCATVQKKKYVVRFYPPGGVNSPAVERVYEHGAYIADSDVPAFFGKADEYLCKWELPQTPVTATAAYYPFVYKKIATPQAFLQMQSTGNYILTADLDFTGVAPTQISLFEGILDGDGHTVRNLTFSGTEQKTLFGSFYGTLKNVAFENVIFEGTQTPLGTKKAYECAVFATVCAGATLENVCVDITYTATGNAQFPNAGLAQKIENAKLHNCIISIRSPSDCSATDFVYAVCVEKAATLSIGGVTVTAGKEMERIFVNI